MHFNIIFHFKSDIIPFMTKRQLEKNIQAFYISTFFNGFLTMIPIWVSFYSGFLTLPQMALLQTLQFSMTVIFELPTGAFADLFGRRNSMILGVIIWGIFSFLIGQSQSALQIFIFVLTTSIGRTFISGANTAWMFDSLKEYGREREFAKIQSLGNVFFQISMAASMIMGGYFFAVSKSLPYTIQGVALLISAGVIWLLGTEPEIDSQKFTLNNYVQQTKDGFTEIFKTKYVAYLSIFYILASGVVNSAQKFFNQIYATEIGFTDIEKGWLFAGIRIVNMLLIFFWARSKLFSRDKTLFLFVILIIISFIPAIIGIKWLGAILLIGLTLGNSARMTILKQFVNEEFSSRVRSTALSSLEMLVSLTFITIVYSSGFFIEQIGTRGILSLVGGLSALILFPLSLWLIQYKKQESFFERTRNFVYQHILVNRKINFDSKDKGEIDA
jgi:MFS family permease